MQLTINRSALELLLERASRASRLVSYLDERAAAPLVGPLGDCVDEIVHLLSELLGTPDAAIAMPDARSAIEVELGPESDAEPVGDVREVVLGGVR